jgi:hypothetical protein
MIACMVAGAAADATAHMHYTELGVGLDILEKLLLFSGVFIFRIKFVPYVIGLLVFYMVGFDYFFNWIHHLPWDYHGTVKAWDIFLSKIPTSGIVFVRIILLTFGVTVTIRNGR